MAKIELEAGKRCAESAVEETMHEFEIVVDREWGPEWQTSLGERATRASAALQLILTRGRSRKIVWLDVDRLRAVGTETEAKEAARGEIRSHVRAAIAHLAER